MPIEYTNRKSQTFYLHQRASKTGKPTYAFSLKAEGNLAETIPAGFEIYENPNGQVFLRKTPPQIITDQERAVIEAGVQQYAEVTHYIIDIKKDAILVYLPDQDTEIMSELLPGDFISRLRGLEQALNNILSYSPVMRFVLADKEQRSFRAERFCYLGSIDDWIPISEPGDLAELVKEFAPHLGQDSFFDLH